MIVILEIKDSVYISVKLYKRLPLPNYRDVFYNLDFLRNDRTPVAGRRPHILWTEIESVGKHEHGASTPIFSDDAGNILFIFFSYSHSKRRATIAKVG